MGIRVRLLHLKSNREGIEIPTRRIGIYCGAGSMSRFPTHCVGNLLREQTRILQIKPPEQFQITHAVPGAKICLETRRQVGKQLGAIARPLLSLLFFLDNLAPDQPVGDHLCFVMPWERA